MSLTYQLRELGGVARITTLIDLGVSRYSIRRALDGAELHRLRRDWVGLPGADPQLLLAASTGTLLTCVTQAKRLGLWVLDEAEPHLASPHPKAAVAAGSGKIHWGRPVIAREPGVLCDSVVNVLGFVAACQPFESALAVWDSALNKGLVDLPALAQLPFTGQARRLLREASPFADSGLETFVRARLRWMRVPIISQAWIDGHRVDFLIDGWLVLQIDGAHHVGAQRSADIRHDAELSLRGYEVMRCSYEQVVHQWHETQGLIQSLLARGRPGAATISEIRARSDRIGHMDPR